MVYKSFYKKTSIGPATFSQSENLARQNKSIDKNENMTNKELAEEINYQKTIIRKPGKRKLHSLFIDNIWNVDLADMKLISKFNKEIRFLQCVTDIFSKYACVISLIDKSMKYND